MAYVPDKRAALVVDKLLYAQVTVPDKFIDSCVTHALKVNPGYKLTLFIIPSASSNRFDQYVIIEQPGLFVASPANFRSPGYLENHNFKLELTSEQNV